MQPTRFRPKGTVAVEVTKRVAQMQPTGSRPKGILEDSKGVAKASRIDFGFPFMHTVSVVLASRLLLYVRLTLTVNFNPVAEGLCGANPKRKSEAREHSRGNAGVTTRIAGAACIPFR